MCVTVLAISFLLFYRSCGMDRFNTDLSNVVVNHLQNREDVAKMEQIHDTWSRIGQNEKGYNAAENSSKIFLTNPKSFECYICYELKFVSLKPSCNHEVCVNCVCKTFKTMGLANKCGQCRKDLPKFSFGYKVIFHQISDLKPNEYELALEVAAAEGHIETIKFLAGEKVDLNRAVDVFKSTPVLIAATYGQTEIVQYLAKKKVNLNKTDSRGASPVFMAAQEGHIDIVKFLAQQKVNLNRNTNTGTTPVFIAAFEGHIEIVKFLAKEKADLNKGETPPIYAAANKGHIAIVKFLIESNVNMAEPLVYFAATEEIKQIIVEALGKQQHESRKRKRDE